MTPAERVAADLTYLADRYEDFHEARLKGTARPWQQPAVMSVRVADRIEAAREHAERNDLAIGDHAAPLHVDVLDALVDLLATADDIAERVAQEAGVDRLRPASSSYDDPTTYLRHAAAHLQGVGYALLEYVAGEVNRLRGIVDRHLGELTTGQTLQAPCPWCRGVTATHPTGGAFTLRVRQGQAEVLIVCESGVCEPPEADSGERHRGHPAWSLDREGAWLAQRIDAAREGVA